MGACDIKNTTRAFIFEQFPALKQRDLNDNSSLLEGGIVDSLGVLDIVEFIEDRFGLTLSDDDLTSGNFETITAISEFIHKQM